MKKNKLQVGVIGLGVGEKHIEVYNSHPSTEVKAICDFSNDKLRKVGGKYPELIHVSNDKEILNDPEIDIVSIASYDNYHFEQIVTAIKNGKHIYVEKPICLFEKEAREIKKLLSLNPKIKISSNLVLRTCPLFIRLKKEMQEGLMGEIYNIQGDYFWGRTHKLTDGWRKDMDYYSIISGASVHLIDLIIWMVGELPVEVSAYGNQISTNNSLMKYNDFAGVLLKFKDSMIAEVKAHGGCIHPHFHALNVMGTQKTFIHNICGSKWIHSNNPEDAMEEAIEEYPGKSNRIEALTSFIDYILDDEQKPLVSKDDVFNSISVCFAAEKAVKDSSNVIIEYI